MRDYKLTLNLITNNKVENKTFKQFDKGNEIELEVLQNENLNSPEKLVLEDETVLAFFKRIDGVVLQKNCEIRNGNIIVTTSQDVLSKVGELELECLIHKDDVEVTTQRMFFYVEESIARSEAIKQDPNYKTDLVTELLNIREIIYKTTLDLINNANSIRYKISYSIDDFPQLESENQKDRFARVIETIPAGATLVVNDGTYDFGGNDLDITKSINIIGGSFGGTIIKDGGFKFKASNITVENIYVDAPELDNGFEGHSCAISNIFIRKCRTKVRDHGFLFESYNGAVQNVLIENCVVVGGKHGFVSKALGVKFINCNANNCTSYGFALVSDNMVGNGKNGQAWNNILQNCYAYKCSYGLKMYCRDKYNSTCVVSLKNNIIRNFIANACIYPIYIGEKTISDSYAAIAPIKDTIIDNVITYSTTLSDGYSLYLENVANCKITNLILDKGYVIENVDEKTKISMGIPIVTETEATIASGNAVLLEGFNNKVTKKDNIVYVDVCVRYKTESSNSLTSTSTLFTLPEEFRPSKEVKVPVVLGRSGLSNTVGMLTINTDGKATGTPFDGTNAFYTAYCQGFSFPID